MSWVNNAISMLLNLANIALAVCLAGWQVRWWRRTRRMKPLDWLIFLLGVYVALMYGYVALAALGVISTIDNVIFGRVFVRPLISVVLGTIVVLVARSRIQHE